MTLRLSLCFAILFFHALPTSPAAADKKHKGHGGGGHGHHGNHHGGHHGSRTQLSFSPYGFNIGVVGDHFGFDLGVPWGAPPAYYDVPPLAYGPEPYGGIEPFYGAPVPPPVIAYPDVVPQYYGAPGPPPASAYPPVVPPQPTAPPLVPNDGLRSETAIPASVGAVPFQTQAERAFRAGRFNLALPAVRHAIAEDPQNGKLMIFESHVHMALGDYNAAAGTLSRGMQWSPPNEWGFVVQKSNQLYRGQMYGSQLRTLEAFLRDNPGDAAAQLVRGYHDLFLGRTATAQTALEQAVALDPNNKLATALWQFAHGNTRSAAPTSIELLPRPAAPLRNSEEE